MAIILLLALPAVSPVPRGVSRLLAQHGPIEEFHDVRQFPRVCQAAGGPGSDCCRKHCLEVASDRQNCRECGRKCRYGEACCGGRCVSVMYDGKNCGGCKRGCKKGSLRSYGMCSDAS
ncbi:stigma-specific STIG1-like protein 1 [Zingiber officinale]|nr:stigma-specific STIG1-like protein 1 [Zingiber officinale]